MYKALIRRIVRAGFRTLSTGNYEQLLRQFDPQVVFSFAGPVPLGGERRGVEAVREWFQHVFSYFPGIQFTVQQVIVQGWPWNTLVATRLLIAAPRTDGSTYQNEAMQFLRLRWGKVIEDRLHEDTYKLAIELQKRLSDEGTYATKRRKFAMRDAQPEGLAKWHKFVRERDMQALADALADTVLFRSPALWKPKEGKATAIRYLSCVARVLEDFTYHRQFVGENAVALEFSARVGELSVKGVDIFQFNDAGQIADFEVMVRPASGLQALSAAIAQQLESVKPE